MITRKVFSKSIKFAFLAPILIFVFLSYFPVLSRPSMVIPSKGFIKYKNDSLLKLHVEGTYIVSSLGKKVKLAGFNVHVKHPWPVVQIDEEGLQWIKNKGFNTVRAVVYWHQFENIQGTRDIAYFTDYLDPLIEWCEKNGLYVIISFHQWHWSPWWGGYGFPEWTTNMYPQTNNGMTECAIDFWTRTGQGNITRDAYIDMVRFVANRYAGKNVIAAYDLFNEPYGFYNPGSLYNYTSEVFKFYNEELVPVIREVNPDTICIYEWVYWLEKNEKQRQPNIVWGKFHYEYKDAYISDQYDEMKSKLKTYFDKFSVEFGAPLIHLEIGGDMVIQNNLIWVQDSLRALDELSGGLGHWQWWRCGKGENGWLPRYSNGTDKSIVPILQQYTFNLTM